MKVFLKIILLVVSIIVMTGYLSEVLGVDLGAFSVLENLGFWLCAAFYGLAFSWVVQP